jgi:YegS/Rv2252/BmrU family lipid kinase
MMKKLLLIFNPHSGRGEFKKYLFETIDIFTRAGYAVTVYPTAASGNAGAYVRARGRGYDLIVCSGGDGMINEIVNALMRMKSPPSFAYIPSGTINDFAASLGMPREIMKSAYAILDGREAKIDVGIFGEKYFAYVAAFGWLTNIPYSTDQGVKNILGRAAYFLEGIIQLVNITSIDCVIEVDDETLEGNFVLGIIANGTSIAGFRSITESGAAIDDGLFEVVLVRGPVDFAEYQEIIGALLDPQANTPLVIQRTAKRLSFKSAQSCDWTVDGEFGGEHKDVEISIAHRALGIIVPSDP